MKKFNKLILLLLCSICLSQNIIPVSIDNTDISVYDHLGEQDKH